jgi:hypothetical protein
VVVYFIDYIVPPSGLIQPRLKPWCSVQGPYKNTQRPKGRWVEFERLEINYGVNQD